MASKCAHFVVPIPFPTDCILGMAASDRMLRQIDDGSPRGQSTSFVADRGLDDPSSLCFVADIADTAGPPRVDVERGDGVELLFVDGVD